MALTIPAYMQRALERQDPNLVVLVDVTLASGEAFYFASGNERLRAADSTRQDYIQNIHEITPISPQLSPLDRKVQVSSFAITFVDDGAIRDFMDSYAWKNALVEVVLAPAELPGSSYEIPYWKGLVYEMLPDGQYFKMQCKDALTMALETAYYGVPINRHPLEVIEEILDAADIPSALIDSTTFDPSTDTAISHLVVSAISSMGITHSGNDPVVNIGSAGSDDFWGGPELSSIDSPIERAQASAAWTQEMLERAARGDFPTRGIPAAPMIDHLAYMCGGSVLTGEDGKIKFLRFDSSASIADTWTSDDVIDFEQRQTWGDSIVNEVHFTLGTDPNERTHIMSETNSQSNYAPSGATAYVRTIPIAMPYGAEMFRFNWAGAWVTDPASDTLNVGTTSGYQINGAPVCGMAGCRVDATHRGRALTDTFAGTFSGSFTKPTDALLSGSRPAYWQVGGEIIKVTGLDVNNPTTTRYSGAQHISDVAFWGAGSGDGVPDVDKNGEDAGTQSFYPARAEITASTRGALSSTAATHATGARITVDPYFDITAAVLMGTAILTRAANGLPIIAVTTSIAKYGLQIGDLVSVVDDRFSWWGDDGSSSAIKWEIVGKEVDIMSGNPTIKWLLAFADHSSPPWSISIAHSAVQPVYVPAKALGISGSWHDETGTQTWVKATGGFQVVQFATSGAIDAHTGWDGTDEYTVQTDDQYDIHAGVEIDALDANATAQLAIEVDQRGGSGYAARRYGAIVQNNAAGARDIQVFVHWQNAFLERGWKVRITLEVSGSSGNVTINAGEEKTFLEISASP